MQPPIPTGTILQNRYRLLSILGQGGFGRTYLAEDLGRFQERCALKEFIPLQSGAYAIEKSQELFQREAAILYQIQHPQIPQFRATFEENQRLFLVQDYVEGKTYRTLLDERKTIGSKFSEAEVVAFLRQMLPVLAHIHAKGIIHRDISPDNIILRHKDQRPVLIDFGVVKELATRVHSPDPALIATSVGKAGYAPSEQMQTGRVAPSSDLYALAVTALVLLTGKEPAELLDRTTLTWAWQQWTQLSPGLTQVLNRMLSRSPSDRFQSVSEVVQALDAQTPSLPNPAPLPPLPPPANPSLSEVATVAVGRRPNVTAHPSTSTPSQKPDPTISGAGGSFWDNPLAVTVVGAGLVVFLGIGSWALVSSVLNGQRERPETPSTIRPVPQPTPQPTLSPTPTLPTPIPSPSPSPVPTPSPSPEPTPPTPTISEQSLNLTPGEPITIESKLKPGETINYILTAEAGQQLSVNLNGDGLVMAVLGPNLQPINPQAEQVLTWTGTLPVAGSYIIELSHFDEGLPESNYKLDVNLADSIPEPEPSPTPEPTPEPTPTPTPTPTPSPIPTPTPSPVPTPEPEPSATPEPEPTPEPSATPEPEPTPEPSATPEPSSLEPVSPESTPEPTPAS